MLLGLSRNCRVVSNGTFSASSRDKPGKIGSGINPVPADILHPPVSCFDHRENTQALRSDLLPGAFIRPGRRHSIQFVRDFAGDRTAVYFGRPDRKMFFYIGYLRLQGIHPAMYATIYHSLQDATPAEVLAGFLEPPETMYLNWSHIKYLRHSPASGSRLYG